MKKVAIKSAANGKYVGAAQAGNAPLIACGNQANAWETFDMIYLDSLHVVFRSHANGLYVAAVAKGEQPLKAVSMEALDWETFEVSHNGDGYSFKSMANGKFVSA